MSSRLSIELPQLWSWIPLKFSTEFLNRGTAPNYVDEGPARAISQAANQATGIDWERTRFHEFNGDPRQIKGYLLPNDVLINSTGNGTLGRVGYYSKGPDETPCFADGHVTVARADQSSMESRFLYYWLSSEPFQQYIYPALVVGATNQLELSRDRLSRAPVPLPPIAEQHRITDFLDAETAWIDALQRSRELQLATLKELVASKISAIVPSRAESSFVRLGYLATVQSGITVDGGRDSGGDAVTLPYLRVANVQNGHLDLKSITEISVSRQVARSTALKRGDVLMTEGGDLDKLGRGTVWLNEIKDCLHQNHVFAVRPDQRRLIPEYLALITRTSYARSYFESTGTKTTNLASTSSSKIRDFRVPIIATETQLRICQATNAWLEDIARVEAILRKQLALLAERRQAMITAAVTGGIAV